MPRFHYISRKTLVCAMAFLLCCVSVQVYNQLNMTLDYKSTLQQRFPLVWSNTHTHTPPSQAMAPYTIQENFTCSANDSTEVIPQHLPKSYQEFLLYRHCLVYPTLLTPSPCEDDLYLLLAVKSTAVQLERRAAVRDTWGRAGRIRGRQVKLIFLMGRSQDQVKGSNLQPLLEWESHRYGDILQWDFADSFLNLTRKEIGFLNWFSHRCSQAQFAFKGDDDVFVNTENMIEFLRAHKPEDHMLTGHIHGGSYPFRKEDSKYFVPVEMYPDGKPYPPFPSGGGYLMSRQTVLNLNAVAQKVKLFPLDDVFVGLCLKQLGLNATFHSGFLTFGFGASLRNLGPCVYHEIMMVHKLNPLELRVMWLMMQDSLPCT